MPECLEVVYSSVSAREVRVEACRLRYPRFRSFEHLFCDCLHSRQANKKYTLRTIESFGRGDSDYRFVFEMAYLAIL